VPPYEDTICACGHGHDASHDPSGECFALDCGCLNDGANICGSPSGNGPLVPRCQKVTPHDGLHAQASHYGMHFWGSM